MKQGNEIFETRKRLIQVCSQWGQEKDSIKFLVLGIIPDMGKRDVQNKSNVKTVPHVLMPGARLFSEVGGIDACVRGMRAPYLQGTDSVGTEAPQMTKRDC